MTDLTDDVLRALLRTDPAAGWRAFIDQYTPLMIGLLRRAGLSDRDEIMDVYVYLCEQLSTRNFERLRQQDPSRGSIGGWLAVLTRHAVVDWIRSRKGRRRLFGVVKNLSPLDQRIFELYYWEGRTPTEIAETLAAEQNVSDLGGVLDSLERIQSVLTDRHRAELMAMAVRTSAPVSMDDTDAAERIASDRPQPDVVAEHSQLNRKFEAALRKLPPEDAAIVRLKYIEGLTNDAIERAIGVRDLTARRLQALLDRLRSLLIEAGVNVADVRDAQKLAVDRSTT